MYERFTSRAREIMQLAHREAERLHHGYIGTEHLLLGLIAEGNGVAANALRNLHVDLARVRREVEKVIMPGLAGPTPAKGLPLTPRADNVVKHAIDEAKDMGHKHVGSEHLLLGLLRETEGVAAQVLFNMGLTLRVVKREVLRLLGMKSSHEPEPPAPPTELPPNCASLSQLDRHIDLLAQEKQEAIAEQDFNRAAQLRDEADRLDQQRKAIWAECRLRHPIDPAWLAWNGGTVRRFAQAIADARAWAMLPILGEILEAAGSRDAVLLDHCREPGVHDGRCWLINMLLAAE